MRGKGTHRSNAQAHGPLAEMARRQHGVVSIRQLTGPLGYSEDAVRRAEASGRLHRLHRGVYAVGHANLPTLGRCLAAVLACGPGALLSHTSAAWLWGVSTVGPFPIHVTTPTHRRRRSQIALHHARALTKSDQALELMIPVTSLPRTFLDSAAVVDANRLERMLARAEELEIFDLRPVEDVLARFAGHPGGGQLVCALEIYRPTSMVRSGVERRFLALIEREGLPPPHANFFEQGYELDAYWPAERFGVELDTYKTHGGHRSFESDRQRQDDLQLVGIEMIQITDVRLRREPRQVAERVRRHLARRRRELRRDSAG